MGYTRYNRLMRKLKLIYTICGHLYYFGRRPLRYVISVIKTWRGRGGQVIIYMKSGNVIQMDCNDMSWEVEGGKFVQLKWTSNTCPDTVLNQICLSQIEAIVSKV